MHTDSLLTAIMSLYASPVRSSVRNIMPKVFRKTMLSFCLTQRQKVTINTKLYPNLSKTQEISLITIISHAMYSPNWFILTPGFSNFSSKILVK